MANQVSNSEKLQLAIDQCARAGADQHKAAEMLAARVRKSPALKDAILEADLDRICLERISRHVRFNIVRPVWNAAKAAAAAIRAPLAKPVPPRRSTAEQNAINRQAAVNLSETLLDLPVLRGKKLRDCTYDDIIEVRDFYGKQGRTMLAKERYYAGIAHAMDRKKVVGESLSLKKIEAISMAALQMEVA